MTYPTESDILRQYKSKVAFYRERAYEALLAGDEVVADFYGRKANYFEARLERAETDANFVFEQSQVSWRRQYTTAVSAALMGR